MDKLTFSSDIPAGEVYIQRLLRLTRGSNIVGKCKYVLIEATPHSYRIHYASERGEYDVKKVDLYTYDPKRMRPGLEKLYIRDQYEAAIMALYEHFHLPSGAVLYEVIPMITYEIINEDTKMIRDGARLIENHPD